MGHFDIGPGELAQIQGQQRAQRAAADKRTADQRMAQIEARIAVLEAKLGVEPPPGDTQSASPGPLDVIVTAIAAGIKRSITSREADR